MAKEAESGGGGGRRTVWRIAAWGTAALLLLLPLVAMQFTDEVNWTGSDFVFAIVMFGSVGAAFELTVWMTGNIAYRGGVGFALLASFLIVWVNGAVGMIGSEGNPYNLLFLGVIPVALAGAILVRFRPAGMAGAMAAAAFAQVAVAAGGLAVDPLGAVLSMVCAGPWLIAAALFRHSGRQLVTPTGFEPVTY